MKRSTILFAVIIASVFSFIWENNLFAAQDNIIVCTEINSNVETPLVSNIIELSYDSGTAVITVSTIQISDLAVYIIDTDSGSVISTNIFPSIPGVINQSYIINAPVVPGEYIIYLTMGDISCQGVFNVE
ncbi:MAG: hypothetical protein IK119_05940 [Bacteroidales bacterium]|nr:hypothetical protein [Bacteroidales bacterium]